MANINGIIICNQCGSNSVTCLGHGGYKQGPNGMGDKKTLMGYQCNQGSCRAIWAE